MLSGPGDVVAALLYSFSAGAGHCSASICSSTGLHALPLRRCRKVTMSDPFQFALRRCSVRLVNVDTQAYVVRRPRCHVSLSVDAPLPRWITAMHNFVLCCDPVLRCAFFVANKASVSLVGSEPFALTSMVAMTLAIVNVHLVRHRYVSLTGNVAKRCPPLKYLIPLWRGTFDQR